MRSGWLSWRPPATLTAFNGGARQRHHVSGMPLGSSALNRATVELGVEQRRRVSPNA
jgi:hypothetical protein